MLRDELNPDSNQVIKLWQLWDTEGQMNQKRKRNILDHLIRGSTEFSRSWRSLWSFSCCCWYLCVCWSSNWKL